MTNDNDEPSAASAGSVGEPRDGALSGCETVRSATQPVAWAALRNGSVEQVDVHPVYLSCDIHRVAPLYLAPAVTDAERKAVEAAYSRLTADTHYAAVASTLRGLLERTNHDAAPAARANAESVAPQPTAGDRSGNPPAAPCVETDGFSSGSRTGQINRTPERESPRRECEESSLRDATHPDTKGRATGGPEHHTLSRAEIDAIQHVVEDGRLFDLSDYGYLRSLLVRLRPEWEDPRDPEPVSDRSEPIKNPRSYSESDEKRVVCDTNRDARLAALEQLSALDQELELKYGLTGNPMIKAQEHTPQANATPCKCRVRTKGTCE